MSPKKTEEVRDIARAADRDAPGPWAAMASDVLEATEVVDATGRSLFDNEGFVERRSVALHIAASDPQTVVALADRVLAHDGALTVLRTGIERLRDAHARSTSNDVLVPTDVAIAQAFLFSLVEPRAHSAQTGELFYLLRLDDLIGQKISVTWQRQGTDEDPTWMLSHAGHFTQEQLAGFHGKLVLAIPVDVVDGLADNDKVVLERFPMLQAKGHLPGCAS